MDVLALESITDRHLCLVIMRFTALSRCAMGRSSDAAQGNAVRSNLQATRMSLTARTMRPARKHVAPLDAKKVSEKCGGLGDRSEGQLLATRSVSRLALQTDVFLVDLPMSLICRCRLR